MTWIATVPYAQAEGRLKDLYDRIKGPGDKVDNIMVAHSLRPHSLEGHMALYKSVLHHAHNTLDRSLLETVGIWVSLLNGCGYCVEHHFAGLRRLLRDDARAQAIPGGARGGRPGARVRRPRARAAGLCRAPHDRSGGTHQGAHPGAPARRARRRRDPRSEPGGGVFCLCQSHRARARRHHRRRRPGPLPLQSRRSGRLGSPLSLRASSLLLRLIAKPGVVA
jgi:AhpD family alkylhydroperoxidase